MSSSTPGVDRRSTRMVGWISTLVGAGAVLAETVGAYVALRAAAVPTIVAYGGTAAMAVVVGGSALYVGGRRAFGSGPTTDPDEKSTLTRFAEIVVSVAVLTAVTVLIGAVGGVALTVLAMLGGPDPETAEGDPLRHRLLDWPQQNREFMRDNGRGALPLNP